MMVTLERYILAYARPGRGESVDEKVARLRPLVARVCDVYADRIGPKGMGTSDLDTCMRNLRHGDVPAVTDIGQLGPTRDGILAILEGLDGKGAGLIAPDDGLDCRAPE